METYTLLRGFADSWFLLFMTLFFLGIVVWAFRPGSRAVHKETASMIFRNDDRPAVDEADASDADAGQRQGA
ncbi:cbb3-type cytochrome c oxidase subunit 3 [Pararhodobacter oceanensis]|uniref:CcoQ/FixQ family Cbb3-type cytochrome c oxidase assembly chaperone n=1 Tax=Pararhodobacter oceanensis TaxID=2172121 RepID=A0A2T8HRV7_9RHOB|nr:cbb3-type cytochrome c oxidase subunit 3 [Pararhodobacter oceanensis]PVH28160.1 CcoQ/FixQ family Cbb3-type cytochrome c oxidase assembly chaperone [Pararhodobacter oceanensis]